MVVYPCPKGGVTWRPKAIELGGKAQVAGWAGPFGRLLPPPFLPSTPGALPHHHLNQPKPNPTNHPLPHPPHPIPPPQFPYLIDPNTDKAMYESDDIIEYLFNEYGDGQVGWVGGGVGGKK